jgi:hypothetical protein
MPKPRRRTLPRAAAAEPPPEPVRPVDSDHLQKVRDLRRWRRTAAG